jgi:hypothetical protein
MSPHLVRFVGLAAFAATATYPQKSAAVTASEPIAPPVTYAEVSRKVVTFKDHSVTLIQVRPPSYPTLPPPPIPVPPTAEEQAMAERYAKKGYANLNVSATVYLSGKTPVTEIRWRNETGEMEYRAWSNADFRYLTQLPGLETETTVYSWFPFVDSCDLKEWLGDHKYPIPAGLTFSITDTEYFIDIRTIELKDQEVTLAALDYLHAYYQINYAKLKADYEKREAENAERERQLRENPPKTPDVTLRFWPIKSTTNTQ